MRLVPRAAPLVALAVLAASCFSIAAPAADTGNHVWRGVMGRVGAVGSFRLASSGTATTRQLLGTLLTDAVTVGAPPGTGEITVVGTWNTTSAEMTLSSSTHAGVLSATALSGQIFGEYTGFSTGPGGIAGFLVGELGSIDAYCGSASTLGGAAPRLFSFAVFTGQIAGLTDDAGSLRRLVGAVLGGTVTANGVTGEPVSFSGPEFLPSFTASGAMNSTMAGGTFDAGGTTGTWLASKCRAI